MANKWKSALVFATLLLFFDSIFARSIIQDQNLAASQKEFLDWNALKNFLELLSSQALAKSELFEGDIKAPVDQLKENYGDGVVDNDANNVDPLENPNLFEGDIVVTADDIAAFYGPRNSVDAKTQKVSSGTKKWPNKVVSYELSSTFSSRSRQIILGAMKEFEEKTCLRFTETTRGSRLLITNSGSGCWSYVGKQRSSWRGQQLMLGEGCVHHGVVLHELGHAIGLWHEQSRPDRDRYINIHQENIKPSMQRQFDLRRSSDYHGEPYNFGSIMHYGRSAFTKNGLDTISVKDNLAYALQGKSRYGQRYKLSVIDVKQINKHYGCYVPDTSPGALHVRIVQAGPFETPGYYAACVEVTDSRDRIAHNCTSYDKIYTTDPSWDEELVFRPTDPAAMFHSFQIAVKRRNFGQQSYKFETEWQTIWVDFKKHQDRFCLTKSLCIPYEYRLVKSN